MFLGLFPLLWSYAWWDDYQALELGKVGLARVDDFKTLVIVNCSNFPQKGWALHGILIP